MAAVDQLTFDGKVVVVTGAGGGLGKAYAKLFAERGAYVVVNDLGGSTSGEGQSQRAADIVVREINSRGGKAVANYDSVEDGEKIIQTAIKSFGRVDILINNAGILRDKSFARTSDTDWDLIHRVHLRGSFLVSRAAWPYMRKQKYGRIIMTSSNAGVYGNFGQANYSAAKLGLVGLSNTLSIEGSKYGIQCNAIVPTAGSRLTQTVMPPDLVEALKPEYVAPLVVWLCHDTCTDTGGVYEAGAGWVGKLSWFRSVGCVPANKGRVLTPEQVRDNWSKAVDMSQATAFTSIQDVTSALMTVIEGSGLETSNSDDTDRGGSGSPVEVGKKMSLGPLYKYTDTDVILYALSVGVSTKQSEHLKFLFEGADDFSVLPTFAVIPSFSSMQDVLANGVPGVDIDLSKALHGEQYLRLHKPFPPTGGTLRNVVTVSDVLDKGSGAVILVDVDTYNADTGDHLSFNQFVTFVVGAGGFGGRRHSDKLVAVKSAPTHRAPDRTVTEVTSPDQAAIYRLNVDRNPLHIDPSFAAMAGFSKPILHGLCSFGYACRHVLSTFCDNDVSRFKAVKVRFSKPVYPGQRLSTSMWLAEGGALVHFVCKSVDSGAEVITGGYVEIEPPASHTVPDALPTSPTLSSSGGPEVKSNAVFRELLKRLRSRPDLVGKVQAVYQWNITGAGKMAGQHLATWTIDLKHGAGDIYNASSKQKPDCVITVSDDDMIGLVTGKLKAPQLFMSGKLKVSGNIMLTQKLQSLLQNEAKL